MARKRVKPRTYWRGGSIAASMLGAGEAVVQSTDERTEAALWPNGTVVAESASQAHVAAAVSAAVDGQRVLIPNGTVTWSSGITTTKQILIRAQNYTPTEGGSSSQSVVITNNASAPLIAMTSGNTYHCGVAGIRFNEGTGDRNNVRFTGSGTKVPLIHDVYMEVSDRFGEIGSAEIAVLTWESLGGVSWNMYLQGIGTGGPGVLGSLGSSVVVFSPRAWATASTMGALDTNGTINVYMEDSTVVNVGAVPDAENNARWVCRYNFLDGVFGTTHGPSSLTGGRHVEYYNNTFAVTYADRNHIQRYYWMRGGTGVFCDNVVNNASFPSEFGNVIELYIGEEDEQPSDYDGYPSMDGRQPGWGHDGNNYVLDPIYVWNETGSRAHTYGFIPDWGDVVLVNRELYLNAGPKPGYSKFTYPHPLRYTPA